MLNYGARLGAIAALGLALGVSATVEARGHGRARGHSKVKAVRDSVRDGHSRHASRHYSPAYRRVDVRVPRHRDRAVAPACSCRSDRQEMLDARLDLERAEIRLARFERRMTRRPAHVDATLGGVGWAMTIGTELPLRSPRVYYASSRRRQLEDARIQAMRRYREAVWHFNAYCGPAF